jgi:acyl carrier protein
VGKYVLDFITYLESEFEIEIPSEESLKDKFGTVKGVVDIIFNLIEPLS